MKYPSLKWLMALLLCLLLCASIGCAAAESAEKTVGDFTFSIPYGTYATLTDYTGKGGAVALPETVDGVPVTGIASSAFASDRAAITDVTLPGTLERISSAFKDCTALTNVTLMEGMTAVGANAFNGCVSLTDVSLPSTLTYIGPGAFAGCVNLAEIKIPESVTEIGPGAFDGCDSLTSITLPAGLVKAAGNSFGGLQSVFYTGSGDQWSALSAQLRIPANVSVFVGNSAKKAEAPNAEAAALYEPEPLSVAAAEPEPQPVAAAQSEPQPVAAAEPASAVPQAHEHQWIKTNDTATCIAAGRGDFTCSVCGATQIAVTNALGHAFAPTFNTNGTLVLNCIRCSTSITGGKLNGAQWSADPNTSANTCAGRGYHLTKLLERTATCTKGGLTEGIICSTCGISLVDTQEMGPRGHWWRSWTITDQGTCITKGKKVRTCRNCSASEERDTDYNYSCHYSLVLVGERKATCCAEGYTGDVYCARCRMLVRRGTCLPKSKAYTDHVGGFEMKNVSAATCTAAGYTGDKYCKGCKQLVEKGAAIPATGHVDNGAGVCKVCNAPIQ